VLLGHLSRKVGWADLQVIRMRTVRIKERCAMYTWTQPRRLLVIVAVLGALGVGAGPVGATPGPVFCW